ncbi:MAG TPA: hypothetical protein PLO28_03815 [bacterium]|nr:hypothetical protein [bacterium]
MKVLKIIMLAGLISMAACAQKQEAAGTAAPGQNWTHFVRIGGHGLSLDRIDHIMESVQETGVFGIETDNDITGRYDSFLDPTEKLAAIKAMADAAHKAGNYAFVYIAGTECITANADKTPSSFFKDHPDWVQRKITGEPAVFGGGTAFWISAGDEDVWISPYAVEWRKIYMERVRQIAATGIDGVYVDIPYWMTHFDGWEDSWASFDVHTVAAFKERTGLDAMKDLKLGDYSDANFRKWVDFRIQTLTEFMEEINDNVKAVNPACMTIPEIYPGIGEEAVRVGSDVYEMYREMDTIAHEYSAGGYTAAERNPIDWFTYMEGMFTFRAFAEGKASWMLSYSWDEEPGVDPRDAMKNLALSQVMAGANFWDARGHVMSGSNDFPTRTEIFKWIAANEKRLYHPRLPIQPAGIYFSPFTRNYFADDFLASYHGMMHLLLQSHLEFQILTPRTLAEFKGDLLILPDVKILTPDELAFFEQFVKAGGKLMLTGESGAYNRDRQLLPVNPLHALLGIADAKSPAERAADPAFIYRPACPGKSYGDRAVMQSYNAGEAGAAAPWQVLLTDFKRDISELLQYKPAVTLQASPYVAAQIAAVDGKPHLFLANFGGLKAKEVAVPAAEQGVTVTFPGTAASRVHFLPYLGTELLLEGQHADGRVKIVLPPLERGAVVWLE